MPSRTHRVTLVALLLTGCSGSDASLPAWQARLNPVASCAEAKTYVRDVALAKMNRDLDEALARFQNGDLCSRSGGGFDTQNDSAGGDPSPPSSQPTSPTTGTGTNNQVAGVDEADFVKNDGQYIYLAQNGVLRIVDAWPADQTHEVSKTTLPGKPKKLFVSGDRALVYVSVGTVGQNDSGWQRPECTYGYDCDFTGDGTQTKLLLFDITSRAAPRMMRQIDLAGSLIAARRIDDAVHTVVTQGSTPFPQFKTLPEDVCRYGGGTPPIHWKLAGERAFEALRAENTKLIEAADLDLRLQGIRDSATPDVDVAESACASLFASPQQDGTAFTSIVSMNLTQSTPASVSTIISRAGAVYADADSLYMAVAHQYGEEQRSTIHKFAVSGEPNRTHYVGSGTVPGRALNQFAMDEQNNFLRIATTIGHAPSDDAVSQLSVLAEQESGDLEIVGSVDGIAPTEDIRSVRFDGTRAFIVTFKKTDPLFAFDLSDPRDPKKLGELKIPGFSTYMHMLDEHHLLTIGYDADDHGSFAFFDGVMLQIFDVSDMTMPRLAHKHIIGTRGSSSEALTNHLAFTWYPEYALLSIPMTLCEGGNDGQYGTNMTFSGLMLFDAGATSGFAEHGRVAHPPTAGISCSNWWTDAESVVRRSLFLDQFVYSISDKHLKVRDVGNLNAALVDLDL
jgi:hypothetical protein